MGNYEEKVESMLKRYRPVGPPAAFKEQIFKTKHKILWRSKLRIAAAIMLVLSIGVTWQMLQRSSRSDIDSAKLIQIERLISRAGKSAQLLSVADVLAKHTGGQHRAKEIYEELIHSYTDLDEGMKAKSRLEFLSERSN